MGLKLTFSHPIPFVAFYGQTLRISPLKKQSASCVRDGDVKPVRDGHLALTYARGIRVCSHVCVQMVEMFFSLSYFFILFNFTK